MKLIAIDPGYEQSAYLIYNTEFILSDFPIGEAIIENNTEVLHKLRERSNKHDAGRPDILLLEMVQHYGSGMAAGKTVFQTCVWIGRFIEAWEGNWQFLYRPQIRSRICGSVRAGDSNIRQALIDRFGPDRTTAIGTKKKPGPLYGIKKDLWSALALAVAYAGLKSSNRIEFEQKEM